MATFIGSQAEFLSLFSTQLAGRIRTRALAGLGGSDGICGQCKRANQATHLAFLPGTSLEGLAADALAEDDRGAYLLVSDVEARLDSMVGALDPLDQALGYLCDDCLNGQAPLGHAPADIPQAPEPSVGEHAKPETAPAGKPAKPAAPTMRSAVRKHIGMGKMVHPFDRDLRLVFIRESKTNRFRNRTDEVHTIQHIGKWYEVRFANNIDKRYRFQEESVALCSFTGVVEIDGLLVSRLDNGTWADVDEVVELQVFTSDNAALEDQHRLVLLGGESAVCPFSHVKLEKEFELPTTAADADSEDAADQPEKVGAHAGEAPKCPKCGAPMKLRRAKTGPHAGQTFWGCSTYPACKGFVPHK